MKSSATEPRQSNPSPHSQPVPELIAERPSGNAGRAANDDAAVAPATADVDNPLWAITLALAVFLTVGAALVAQG